MHLPHTALILCGGRGTRLQHVVSDRPKFLAPVAGRPYADYLLRLLSRSVREVVLCTGYMAEQIEEYCGDGSRWGLSIRYSREPEALGTAGAITHALGQGVTDPFWVLNGDSFVTMDLEEISALHARTASLATLVVVEVPDALRYGAVVLGPEQSVLKFGEKSSSGTGYINAGVYLLATSVLDGVEPGRMVSLERDVLPQVVGKGAHAWISPGPFIDIGTEESFHHAQQLLAEWPERADQ